MLNCAKSGEVHFLITLFLRRPGGYTVEHTKCVTWFFLHLNLEKMKLRSNYFLIFLALPLALSAQEQPASSPVAQHPAIARFQNSHPYLALPPDWTPYPAFRAPARQQAANAPTLSWQLYPRNANPVFTPALMVPFNKQGRYYDRNPVSFQPTKCDKFWGTTAKVIGISLWFLGNNDQLFLGYPYGVYNGMPYGMYGGNPYIGY